MTVEIDADLRENLVCPKCRGDLRDVERGLLCPVDKLVYPVDNGVPYLVAECALSATDAELKPA